MKKIKRTPLNNKGFSLVELIIVIAIMAILLGVMAPNLLKYIEKSKEAKRLSNADTFRKCYELAAIDLQADGIRPATGGTFYTVNGVLQASGANQAWDEAAKKILDETFTGNYENTQIRVIYDATGAIDVIKFTVNEDRKTYDYAYIGNENYRDSFPESMYKEVGDNGWLLYVME